VRRRQRVRALAIPAPSVTVEAVVAAAPDVIVGGDDAGKRPPWLDDWKRWPSIPAVRDGNLYGAAAISCIGPGPRFVDGVVALVRGPCERAKRRSARRAGTRCRPRAAPRRAPGVERGQVARREHLARRPGAHAFESEEQRVARVPRRERQSRGST
jgi:hypothetical protein